ncbi:CHAD domain-containing protein [Sulfurospirillum barnesii]|uniref:CHAD domain-containing protein n=1 Tax=Sulfurospirillum barnesii (strain ATCC 700032 / DSM 10660 / SES-3) TaxID=760154 RepID=I3XWJ9_SULBS|nr:CHAD domain-containing protein [Sulfurospirillum barnesii]AFL68323.1 hypothetical protein Sulba_1024 [Sulfurospirillum barnesii SES-3]
MSKKICLESPSIKDLLQETFLKAIHNIARYLDDVLQTKEAESLHQFRVNIRLARSLCKEFSMFMEKNHKKALSDRLEGLQQETNDMRDLDVFIECIQTYKTKVDKACESEFKRIEKALLREKKAAYVQFCKQYSVHQENVTAIEALLKDEQLYLSQAEGKWFVPAQKILEKRFKKIAKLSQKIALDSANEQFHTLRLHYKKLRYTCDALQLTAFAKSFKPIQTAFGHVQDKNMQIAYIQQHHANKSVFLEQIIALLEEELLEDKRQCIKKSNKRSIEKLHKKLHAIITCKKR